MFSPRWPSGQVPRDGGAMAAHQSLELWHTPVQVLYTKVWSVVGLSPTRGSSFFLGKVTALGVLCCFALLFV